MLSERGNLRSTLVDIYHSYCESDSETSELSEISQSKMLFFRDFIKRNKLISCRIQNISTVPKQSIHRAYTLYQIDSLTEQLFFTTQKRYSEFEKLYQRIQKFLGKDIELKFPKKTYFNSGTEISVTTDRVVQLNQFINVILKLNDEEYSDVKLMFLDFLGVWEKYLEKGIDVNNSNGSNYDYFLANKQNIYIEILKLNENPKNISVILERIRKLIFDYRIKVSLETARQIYLGLENEKKGLLIYALDNDNEYLAIQCLNLIYDLLDVEKSRNSEIFLKALHNCSPKRLVVSQRKIFENIEFKRLYFNLLKKYQSKVSDKEIKAIFGSSSEVYKQFRFWNQQVKEQRTRRLTVPLVKEQALQYDKEQCKRSFQKVKERIERSESGEFFLENDSGQFFEGQSHIGFKIVLNKNSQNEDLKRKLDRSQWETFKNQIRSEYTDVVTKTLNHKNERRFKFNENMNKDAQNQQITLEPIHTHPFDDCFYEFSEIKEKENEYEVVQLIYFCHNNSQEIKKFMKEKLLEFWQHQIPKEEEK